MKKQPMSDEKVYPILKSTHMIGVLAEIIKVEHHVRLIDVRFKNPNLNNHSKKIVESANQIQVDLRAKFDCMKRDELTYDHALQLHRLLDHFIEIGIERTTEFMDLVDSKKAEFEANPVGMTPEVSVLLQ
jgi:hypothetical protein